jgi:uncharacterized repeat protein (TIGR01451 family)
VGTYENGIWTIPSLASGATATLTISGIATAVMAGCCTPNTATIINQTEYDPHTIGESVTKETYTKEANMALSQTANYQGNGVTFTVTATNNGPDTATNINITDLIPAGLTNVTITPSIGTYENGIWVIPSLENGVVAILTITGTAVPQSTITNTATRISQTEYNTENSISTFSIYTPLVDVSVYNFPWSYDKSTSSYQMNYSCGNSPVFSFTVMNRYDEVSGVIVQYEFGDGFSLISYDTRGIGSVTVNGRVLTWTIDKMPKGGIAFMNIVLRVILTGDRTPNLTTTARLVSLDSDYVDNNSANNQMNCSITVPSSADIQVNQTINGNPVYNEVVTYTITTTNNGPNTASNIKITDNLPTGLGEVVITPSVGTFANGIWTIPTLSNGETATLTITAKITATSGTIINTATKTSQDQDDWNYNNNAATTYLTISGIYTPLVDVSVYNFPWSYDKSTSSYQMNYSCGNSPVFSFTVMNRYDEVSGVIVQYEFGDGFSLISYDTRGIGSVTVNGRVLTWTIDKMPKGGIAFMNIVLRVILTGDRTPNLTTTARLVSLDSDYVDNNSANNQMNCSITVPSSADIQVNQTINGNPVYNEVVTYTITTTNNGPNTASNIKITDNLPTGLGEVVITPSVGTFANGIWTIPTLSNGETATLTITAKITATSGTIINTATKTSQDQDDWNYNNNSQTIYLNVRD